MINRKQLCELILRKYCVHELNMSRTEIDITKIPEGDVFKSSTIAICMEELGLLSDPAIKYYTEGRGGIALSSFDENGEPIIISFREILNSLKE